MGARNSANRYGRQTLVASALTAVAIGLNHWHALGTGAVVLAVTIATAGGLLWLWFERTQSRIAFGGFIAVIAWVVVGFGITKGLWGTTLRLLGGTLLSSLSSGYPRPLVGTMGFEMGGVLMFIGSAFVAYYAFKLLQSRHESSASDVTFGAGAAIVAVALSAAFAWTDRDRFVAPADGVVRIGVIVPTTGPYAVLGNSFVKAVEMAAADLKETRYRYELVVRDSGPDPAKARDVIERVISRDKVNAIVGGVSLIGQVTQPLATRARIPHTCVCTVKSIGDGVYNFTNIPSPEAEATAWVREADRRGIRRIALMTQDYPSINGHVRALKAKAARTGLAIVFENRFDADTSDFRSAIEESRASRPDICYVETFNPTLDILGQQLADARIRNISSVVAPSLSEKPQLFEGAWYTDSDLRDIAFKKRFEDKYPGTQFATHMMPYAYDSVNMIVRAFEAGKNPAVYLRDLRSYEGTADLLTKEPGRGNFMSAPAVWTMTDGKPVLMHKE